MEDVTKGTELRVEEPRGMFRTFMDGDAVVLGGCKMGGAGGPRSMWKML